VAAPVVIGTVTSAWNATAANTLIINKPSGVQDGDYLVAFLRSQSAGATADWTSSGWTRISTTFSASQAGPRLIGMYALPVPSASALTATSFTFTFTGTAGRVIGAIALIRGVDTSAPVSAVSTAYGGTNITNGTRQATYTNTAGANGLGLALYGGELVAGNTNAVTISTSPSTTMTPIFQNDTANDGTAGTTGSRTSLGVLTYAGITTSPQIDVVWGTIASPGSEGIVLKGLNVAPTAAFTSSKVSLALTVDGTTSTDSDGTISSYDWNWGDSTTHGTGSTSSHTYATAGTYTVTLTVTDNGGLTGTTSASVTVTGGTPTRPFVVGTPTTGLQTTTTALSLTINKPGGVADGDWLIAALRAQDGSATTDWTLSGWSRIGNAFVANSATGRLSGFYAKYIPSASAETATSYTFTWTGGGGRAVGTIIRVQGANTTSLVDAYSVYLSNTITNGARLVSFSVPDSNGLQLAYAANEQVSPNASESVTHGSDYTLVQFATTSALTSTSRTTLELYQKDQDAGSTSQFDVTWAATSSSNIQSVVLKPITTGNIAPVASFTTSVSGLSVTATNTSTDSDGTIASMDLDWGDSTTHATTSPASHTYATAGTYTVTLSVTDNSGSTSTSTATITVSLGSVPVPHFGTGDSTSVVSASAATLTGNKPANVANGDLLVAYLYSQNTAATVSSVPTGWTLVGSISSRPASGIYVKPIPTASAESATSYTWTISAGTGRMILNIFRVTGADLTNPLDVAGVSGTEVGGGTSFPDASVTTNYPNSLLLGFNYWNNSSTAISVITAPAGMTAGDQLSTPTTSNTSGTLIAYQAQAASGATGTRTFTYAAAATNVAGQLIAIKETTVNPVASYSYSSTGQTLSVDGTASSGVAGATIASYDWNWGDSTTHGTGSTTTHTYTTRGTFTVILTVTDSNGLTGAASKSVIITDAGYAGIWRDSGGVNHPGLLYYWDGSAKHAFNSTLTNIFQPVTVTQFLSAAHSPWFSAHRGFSYSYPEETLYGYQGTVDWGMKAIEVSAQMSASGTWWCFHDATTDRTTGVSGTIASMTDAQIAVLNNQGSTATGNPGQPARPTAKLVDVLNLYYKTHVIIIEDKTYTHTTAMLNLLDSYGTSGRPASDIFIWKVASSSSKTNFFDPAAARGYHRWAYIFDNSMSTEFPALPASGKADMIGMDYNSSDATLSSAIALCIANGVMPTGHIITNTTQRDRLLGLGMKGLMMASKDAIPPWYNLWAQPSSTVYNFPSSLGLTPGTLTDDAGSGLSLGILITCKVSGLKATGIRWFAGQTQSVTPYLWDAGSGAVLATGVSTSCGVGWNTISFTTPFSLVSGNDYIVGTYQATQKYTASNPTWPQSTPQFGISSATMGTGYYSYSTTPGLSETSGSTNQWYGIDIVATS
jgi:PKD repeat protein